MKCGPKCGVIIFVLLCLGYYSWDAVDSEWESTCHTTEIVGIRVDPAMPSDNLGRSVSKPVAGGCDFKSKNFVRNFFE